MNVNSSALFQLFKYVIYVLLGMNIYWFFDEESAAAALQFSNGIAWAEIIEGYSATIDTAAWVVLLLMFELETYVLEDHHFTRPVRWSLHGLRFLCYAFIVYAFYGYLENLDFVHDTVALAGVTDVCALLPAEWSWAMTLDEYATISASNCASLSDASAFYQFREMAAIVDAQGLREIRYLAWVDVINAAVWLGVVVVLEFDVRMQERDRLEGLILRLSNAAKVVLYSLLFLAAIYWGVKGDFIDFWDAFLWLVAFIFIELNVFEWRKEELAEAQAEADAAAIN